MKRGDVVLLPESQTIFFLSPGFLKLFAQSMVFRWTIAAIWVCINFSWGGVSKNVACLDIHLQRTQKHTEYIEILKSTRKPLVRSSIRGRLYSQSTVRRALKSVCFRFIHSVTTKMRQHKVGYDHGIVHHRPKGDFLAYSLEDTLCRVHVLKMV